MVFGIQGIDDVLDGIEHGVVAACELAVAFVDDAQRDPFQRVGFALEGLGDGLALVPVEDHQGVLYAVLLEAGDDLEPEALAGFPRMDDIIARGRILREEYE